MRLQLFENISDTVLSSVGRCTSTLERHDAPFTAPNCPSPHTAALVAAATAAALVVAATAAVLVAAATAAALVAVGTAAALVVTATAAALVGSQTPTTSAAACSQREPPPHARKGEAHLAQQGIG
ncbi:hypothetical protein QAD02_023121 [Eretmocerus hayati]|uniref:Uncharacterized protein n=1 Tax=Eretmocerus hayati TaxID=131215 RepID=A0ACC2PYA6_9HYME|nr:hypothetical protein QAD02_023121 [Eretmocerus hayati]